MTVVPVGNYEITVDGSFYVLGGVHSKGSVVRVGPGAPRDNVLEDLAARGWLKSVASKPTPAIAGAAPPPAAPDLPDTAPNRESFNRVSDTTRDSLQAHADKVAGGKSKQK